MDGVTAARNVMDLRKGLLAGNGYQAAFSAACDDKEIREFCQKWYGWQSVKLTRDPAIVRAQPGGKK